MAEFIELFILKELCILRFPPEFPLFYWIFLSFSKSSGWAWQNFQTFFNKLALDPTHFNNINGVEKSCLRLD